MEPFLPTLLGAFAGISVPFVISAILNWAAYRRALNAVFAFYETETQGYRARSLFLAQLLQGDPDIDVKKLQSIAVKNFQSSPDLASTLVSQYSRYVKSEDVFHLVQDRQNIEVLTDNLRADDITDSAGVSNVVEHIVEFAARRTFSVFRIAKRTRVEFSAERYNALISDLNRTRTKRVTRVRKRSIAAVNGPSKKPSTSP